MSKAKLIKKEEKTEKSTGETIGLTLSDESLEQVNGGYIASADKPCPCRYCGGVGGKHKPKCPLLNSHL